MKTVEIDKPASTAAMYLGALLSSRKRPGAIEALPEVTYVRPQVVLESAHIANYSRVCGFTKEHGVPVTYPQMLTFPLVMAFFCSADCPWPALGTVHLANRIEQRQRLSPGDALRVARAQALPLLDPVCQMHRSQGGPGAVGRTKKCHDQGKGQHLRVGEGQAVH